MKPPRRSVLIAWLAGLVGIAVLVTAAGSSTKQSRATVTGGVIPADPDLVFDPVRAGEAVPAGYRPLLDRDQIEPIYNPEFTTADGVDWPAESLVLGMAGDTTAKAYPITHLNRHEMVIDTLEGDPILVSW